MASIQSYLERSEDQQRVYFLKNIVLMYWLWLSGNLEILIEDYFDTW